MTRYRPPQWWTFARREESAPVDRSWVWWHIMLGLGVGLLAWPSRQPHVLIVVAFLWSSTMSLVGLLVYSAKLVSRGLLILALASAIRAVTLWNADLHSVGSNAVATFVWAMLAIGNAMKACAVKQRGISEGWWMPPPRRRRRGSSDGVGHPPRSSSE